MDCRKRARELMGLSHTEYSLRLTNCEYKFDTGLPKYWALSPSSCDDDEDGDEDADDDDDGGDGDAFA